MRVLGNDSKKCTGKWQYAPVAQLDRVFDYESKGREFESSRARANNSAIVIGWRYRFGYDRLNSAKDSR